MKLSEIFASNRNIIINSDIDGILSGMILQAYYGCKIVGFSNSRETIWVSEDVASIYDPVYIDLYVNKPKVACIEQHIVAFDKNHLSQIKGLGTKLNPNLDRNRTFCGDADSDYFHKYPFGTVHYLISLMTQDGFDVGFNDLHTEVSHNGISTNVGHIILRADDALYSTLSKYRENALDWWRWLDPDRKSKSIQNLIEFGEACDTAKAWEYKNNIGNFFKSFGCDGSDGAFDSVTDRDGFLLSKVSSFVRSIGEYVGFSLELPQRYIIHKGQYGLGSVGVDSKVNFDSPKLYSYAFIYGPKSPKANFSYTISME